MNTLTQKFIDAYSAGVPVYMIVIGVVAIVGMAVLFTKGGLLKHFNNYGK